MAAGVGSIVVTRHGPAAVSVARAGHPVLPAVGYADRLRVAPFVARVALLSQVRSIGSFEATTLPADHRVGAGFEGASTGTLKTENNSRVKVSREYPDSFRLVDLRVFASTAVIVQESLRIERQNRAATLPYP